MGSSESLDVLKYEEAKSWGDSLTKLLESSSGRDTFYEFLKKIHAEENLELWVEITRFQKIEGIQDRKTEAYDIFTRYLGIDAENEVVMSREIINKVATILEAEVVTSDCLDFVQTAVVNLLREPYGRFLQSAGYKKLLFSLNSMNPYGGVYMGPDDAPNAPPSSSVKDLIAMDPYGGVYMGPKNEIAKELKREKSMHKAPKIPILIDDAEVPAEENAPPAPPKEKLESQKFQAMDVDSDDEYVKPGML